MGYLMRKLSVILMACLVASNAYAADIGPLAPGMPAGVSHSQIWDVKSLGAIVGGVGLIVVFSLLISTDAAVINTPINGISGSSAIVPIVTTTTTTTTQ